MMPRVYLIVLCHNGIEMTLDCLESLWQQDYAHCEILVVDNASEDGTAERVRTAYPRIDVASTGGNLGYTGGNNFGMRIALAHGADAFFLINNDTWLDPQCVSTLIESMAASPQVGIIGPMVYAENGNNVISSAGGQIDWRHADARNVGAGEADQNQYAARSVDFVNGCGMLVTAAATKQAGMLDPRYFMYWEETDWCTRLSRAGFSVLFEPAAKMRHKATLAVSDLAPMTLYYVTRNRLRFFAIHTPLGQRPVALAHALNGIARGVIRHRKAGRRAHARATQLAVWHALIGRWGRCDAFRWQIDHTVSAASERSRVGRFG